MVRLLLKIATVRFTSAGWAAGWVVFLLLLSGSMPAWTADPFFRHPAYLVEGGSEFVAVGDFNGDGHADLAVIDLTPDTLVDPGDGKAGLPGIPLVGTIPSLKMHRDARARRRFVAGPGQRLNVTGGLEEIDLDALTSLGFMFWEEEQEGRFTLD